MTGYWVFLGDNLISWRSKKQNAVSRSLAEVEYRSMASTCCEITWLFYLLEDFRIQNSKTTLLCCENKVALHIAANPKFHERTKHIEVDCHLIREKIQPSMIKTFHVKTNMQLANVFTKALGVPTFMNLIDRLRLINIFCNCIIFPKPFQDTEAVCTSEVALVLRGTVKKSVQKRRSEVVLKKESKNEISKAKMQKKTVDQNDKSIVILLRKLLVTLEGK